MNALKKLIDADFAPLYAGISTADGLHFALSQHSAILALRTAIGAGSVTLQEVETEVAGLLESFRRGERFVWDHVIAGVAVVLGSVLTKEAEQFLKGLSAIRVAEMPMSPRVAAIAIAERARKYGQTTSKEFELASPMPTTGGNWLKSASEEPVRMQRVA